MSGVLIAGELLHGDGPLTAVVPPTSIKAWKLPQGTPTPSLVVTRISRVALQLLDGQASGPVTERIQVTARASSGLQREQILGLARRACVGKLGTIAGYARVAVLYAGDGPDFADDAAEIFMGSFDLRVSFAEPA